MNQINKPSPILALLIAGALSLAGCGAAAPSEEPPLAGAAIGGDFALSNSAGQTVRWTDFAGKYRVVYFGYAFCPDVCPTDMQRIAQGLKVLKGQDPAKAAMIAPITRKTPAIRLTPSLRTSQSALPPLWNYTRDADETRLSLVLGAFVWRRSAAAWRLRILWLLSFGGGDGDELVEVDG